jgi:uncharacterized protein YndB with AHSA1/START domain
MSATKNDKAPSAPAVAMAPKGERSIVITRRFSAPRELVFDAMTKPALMKKWLNGPPGWTMTLCNVDLRPGGTYRYMWRNQNGEDLGISGVFKEVDRPKRMVQTVLFDKPWYNGGSVETMVLAEKAGGTVMTLIMEFASRKVRDEVIGSPMGEGLGYGYERLEELLTDKEAEKTRKGPKENALQAGISESGRVDAFMAGLEHPLHDVAQRLRKVILGTDKSIGEGIFWNAPTFYYTGKLEPFDPKTYKRYIVGFNFFRQDTIRLIFLRGAAVADKSGLLTGDYKDGRRLALFHSMDDLKKKEPDLKRIVKEIVKYIT